MTQRATAIARKLNTILKKASVMVAPQSFKPQLVHGPVITVTDGISRGITLTVFCEDSREIGDLAALLFKATKNASFPLDHRDGFDNEVCLNFRKMSPVLDQDDAPIGEMLEFIAIEFTKPHSTHHRDPEAATAG